MGGGKTGGGKIETPKDFVTKLNIGSALDSTAKTLDDSSTIDSKSIDKKKMGTRGLQIPLTSQESNTKTATAANTGVAL